MNWNGSLTSFSPAVSILSPKAENGDDNTKKSEPIAVAIIPIGRTAARSKIMAPPLGSSDSKYSWARAVEANGKIVRDRTIKRIKGFFEMLNIISSSTNKMYFFKSEIFFKPKSIPCFFKQNNIEFDPSYNYYNAF